MTEREYRELISTTSGQFGGVGIEISVEEGVPQVISAIEGTPAAAAGIEPGDRIVKADGQPIVGMDIGEVVRRLRGNPGTPVVLTIARANRPMFDLPITRAIIHVEFGQVGAEAGRHRLCPDQHLRRDHPGRAARRAVPPAPARPAGISPGLSSTCATMPAACSMPSVEVAGDFLDSGTVVSTRGREPSENRVYDAPPNGDLVRGTPMVVLINGASASASEIVAGALQDNRRATILGTHSFGKGSVQSIIPIEGYGALRLTTALYYTPSGRSIQGHGISPDRVVTVPKDQQVANAVITFESDLFGALKPTGALAPTDAAAPLAPPRPIAEETDHPINPKVIGTPQDAQLRAALDAARRPSRRGAVGFQLDPRDERRQELAQHRRPFGVLGPGSSYDRDRCRSRNSAPRPRPRRAPASPRARSSAGTAHRCGTARRAPWP